MVVLKRTFPRVAWRRWRVMQGLGGWWGCFLVWGGCYAYRPWAMQLSPGTLRPQGKPTAHVSAKCPAAADSGGLCHRGASGGRKGEGRGTNDHHKTPPSLPTGVSLPHSPLGCMSPSCFALWCPVKRERVTVRAASRLYRQRAIRCRVRASKPAAVNLSPKVGESSGSQLRKYFVQAQRR